MKIEYIDHSIGNRFDDTIELNVNLKKYPKLHRAILEHELGHDSGLFSIKDLKHDLKHSVSPFELMKFMIKNPKSLTQFLPIYFHRKYGLVYDLNMILIYMFIFSLIGVSIYLGLKI